MGKVTLVSTASLLLACPGSVQPMLADPSWKAFIRHEVTEIRCALRHLCVDQHHQCSSNWFRTTVFHTHGFSRTVLETQQTVQKD